MVLRFAPTLIGAALTAALMSPPVAAGSSPAHDTACVVRVAHWDHLNVRSGPSPRARRVGALAPEACGIEVLGPCRGHWCVVARGRTQGWVNTAYLAEETLAPAARTSDAAVVRVLPEGVGPSAPLNPLPDNAISDFTSDDFGTVTGTSEPPIVCVNTPSGGPLNVRYGPGIHHPITDQLRHRQCYIDLTNDCDGAWCVVASEDVVGWVHTDFLRQVN